MEPVRCTSSKSRYCKVKRKGIFRKQYECYELAGLSERLRAGLNINPGITRNFTPTSFEDQLVWLRRTYDKQSDGSGLKSPTGIQSRIHANSSLNLRCIPSQTEGPSQTRPPCKGPTLMKSRPQYAGEIWKRVHFYGIGQQSTLIPHETGDCLNRSSNRRNLKTSALRFSVDGRHSKNQTVYFLKRCSHDNRMIFLPEFFSNRNPKWPVIAAFLNSTSAVRFVFRVKLNSSGVVWTVDGA